MTIDDFWQLIAGITPESFDMKAKCRLLAARLETLPPQELRDFADHYWTCKSRAYHWPLWDAAALIHGGCGDDSFMDFRSALITFGRDVFERALTDPDTLADLPHPIPRSEEVYGVIHEAIAKKLGEDYTPPRAEPAEPTGISIEKGEEDDEEVAQQTFPKLAARYSNQPASSDGPQKPWWKFW